VKLICKLQPDIVVIDLSFILKPIDDEELEAILLTDPAIKVYEVAERVGYPDSRYFSTLFKKWTALTPTEFRSYYMQEA